MISCSSSVLAWCSGWLLDVVRNNFVTIAKQLAAIPEDVLAANEWYNGWVDAMDNGDEDGIIELCAAVTSHFASQGKVSAMPTMTRHLQSLLGLCLHSSASSAGLLFDVLASPSLELYLPQGFIRNMVQELGVGTTSLIQLNSIFHEKQRGKSWTATEICQLTGRNGCYVCLLKLV